MSNLTTCIDRHLRALSGGRSTLLAREWAAMLDDLAAAGVDDADFTAAVAGARQVATGELMPVSAAVDALLDLRLAAALLPA